jgi:hypothetical protein
MITVKIETWNSVSISDLKKYARDALGHWGGSLHPDDEFFPSNIRIGRLDIKKVEEEDEQA